jgi:hypothetical protein
MQEITVYNLSNLPTIDFESMVELQRDFKLKDQQLLDKLKRRILEVGFKYSFKAWKDPADGNLYIVDAHQRRAALSDLRAEGYTIPAVPYELIHAKDRKAAVEEIAYVNSEYAKKNPDTDLFKHFNVNFGALENVHIPNFDVTGTSKLVEETANKLKALDNSEAVSKSLEDKFVVQPYPVFNANDTAWKIRNSLWQKHLKGKGTLGTSIEQNPALLEILVRWFNEPDGVVYSNLQLSQAVLNRMGVKFNREVYDLAVVRLHGTKDEMLELVDNAITGLKDNRFAVLVYEVGRDADGTLLDPRTLLDFKCVQRWNDIVVMNIPSDDRFAHAKALNETRQLNGAYSTASVIIKGNLDEVKKKSCKIVSEFSAIEITAGAEVVTAKTVHKFIPYYNEFFKNRVYPRYQMSWVHLTQNDQKFFKIIDGCLCIFEKSFLYAGAVSLLLPPMSITGNLQEEYRIIQMCSEAGIPTILSDEDIVLYSCQDKVIKQGKMYEYLHRFQAVPNYSGKEWESTRRAINKFKSLESSGVFKHDYLQRLTVEQQQELDSMYKEWKEGRDFKVFDRLGHERVNEFDKECGVTVGIVRNTHLGRISAYTILEKLGDGKYIQSEQYRNYSDDTLPLILKAQHFVDGQNLCSLFAEGEIVLNQGGGAGNHALDAHKEATKPEGIAQMYQYPAEFTITKYVYDNACK